MKKLVLLLMAGSVFCGLCGCGGAAKREAGRVNQSNILPTDLARIKQLFDQDRLRKADKEAKKWIKANKESDFMDRALFISGESLFGLKSYYKALKPYEELLDRYSASRHFEAVLRREMEIAEYFLAGGKRKMWGFLPITAKTEALAVLEQIEDRWPGSTLAAEALNMQADYYFKAEKFLEAQHTYQMIIEGYRGGPYYETAMLRSAEATHNQYVGSYYDTICLDEALIRYNHYQLNFPEKSQQLDIVGRIGLIRRQQAMKCFEIADFYRRTGKDQAAEKYWQITSEQWPETEFAVKSQKLLDED